MWCSGTSICQRTRSGSGTAFNLRARAAAFYDKNMFNSDTLVLAALAL